MEIPFWQQRWAEDKIGFHLESVNPALVRFWDKIAPALPAKVFIPMAGKSLDLIWLANKGYDVVAIEVSVLAVEAFFREHDLTPTVTQQDNHSYWQSGRITFICGDFFKLEPVALTYSQSRPVDIVYDRAAYIALPVSQREKYRHHLNQLCPEVPRLLITLEYDAQQMPGPPFSVEEQEVIKRYAGSGYTVETLSRDDVLLDHEHFMAKGMTQLFERIYYLQPSLRER